MSFHYLNGTVEYNPEEATHIWGECQPKILKENNILLSSLQGNPH